jgi:hypothetical protein
MQIQQMLSSFMPDTRGLNGGTSPSLFSFRDLDIRMPPQMLNFADDGKAGKAIYGNGALARQPQPNVIILINNRNDGVAINGSHITAPHRTLVVVAHGGPGGIQKPSGVGNYTAADLATEIKQTLGLKLKQYDQIVFVSCRVALAGNKSGLPNGTYTQTIANALGKPVYAPTEFAVLHGNSGKMTIAGSTTHASGIRNKDVNDLGRFIRFDPGGKPSNSPALQTALGEHRRADEDKVGTGAKVDDEFSGILKAGRCVNASVAQCIRK